MRLRGVKLANFRCYENEFSLELDDFTCLIGKNDIGKSTIFDALEIFFNTKKIDVDDKTKNTESTTVTITCIFDHLPNAIIIDSSYETSLQNEYLLNAEGYLEITQEYKCAEKSAKLSQTYATANHPAKNGIDDLLELKHPALKKLAEDNAINLEDIDTRVSALIRQAIWSAGKTDIKDIKKIPLDKEGAKQIWDSIQVFLPSFALFKSDRVSSDQDSEAQDPLKEAIKEAARSVDEQFNMIISQVETEVEKVAEATLKKLNEMDPDLTSTLNPIIKTKPLSSLFSTSIVGDENIPLNKRGSGVRRLILLNFFRAKAELHANEKKKHSLIYAVEEPETSQHPNNQKMLVRALSELSENPSTQVMMTTHSPMLTRTINTKNLRLLQKSDGKIRSVNNGGTDEVNLTLAQTLGVLPDHDVKLFIGIEGINDVKFLKAYSSSLCADNVENIPDLEDLENTGKIIFLPMGGGNLAHDTSRFANLNVQEYHIYDRDCEPPAEPKYQQAIAEINARNSAYRRVCA